MTSIFLITGTASERGGHGEPSQTHTTLIPQDHETWYGRSFPLLPAFTSRAKAEQYIKDNRLSTHWCKIIELPVI